MKLKAHYVMVFVLCVVSFGLLIASTSTDWYYQSVETKNANTSGKNCNGTTCIHYLLQKTSYLYSEISVWTANQTYTNATHYSEHNFTTTKTWAPFPKAFGVLKSSRGLAISAVVFSAFEGLFCSLVLFHYGLKSLRRVFKYLTIAANLLAFILSLASVSYFAQFSPAYISDIEGAGKKCTDLICKGFYGYKTSTSGKITTNDDWGWSSAWSEVFSASFFLLFSLGLFAVKFWKKKTHSHSREVDL